MKFKMISLIGCLAFTGCQSYDIIQHRKIEALQDLSNELKQQQEHAKDRYAQYKAKGDQTGMLQTGQIIGITKGSTPVIDDATENAKPVAKFIVDKGIQGITPLAPFLGPYGGIIEGVLGLVTVAGGAMGAKKGHSVLTRRSRIKDAVAQVKASPIGTVGNFDPCNEEVKAAMKLYLNADDYKVWCQSHGCA